MKTILVSVCILISINCSAQKKTFAIDITQANLLCPVVVFNSYGAMEKGNLISFMQFGIGAQIAVQKSFYEMLSANISSDPYPDKVSLFSYNGVMLRAGWFTGKLIEENKQQKRSRLPYYGGGLNLKYATNKNIKVMYEYNTRDIEVQKNFRIQSEKTIIFSPFFNSGIQLFRNRFMSEGYAGIQANIKFRNKNITYEQTTNPQTGKIQVNNPYKENQINAIPTVVVGFRIGNVLK